MEDKARIRINLSIREIELEGTEAFIDRYSEMIQDYLTLIKEPVQSPDLVDNTKAKFDSGLNAFDAIAELPSTDSMPTSFGEFYSRFPKSIKDVDRILLAGYFFQQRNGNSAFSNQDASSLLLEQNVKLTNASAFLKANLEARKIFKHEGKYKVSEVGAEHIKKLMMG